MCHLCITGDSRSEYLLDFLQMVEISTIHSFFFKIPAEQILHQPRLHGMRLKMKMGKIICTMDEFDCKT